MRDGLFRDFKGMYPRLYTVCRAVCGSDKGTVDCLTEVMVSAKPLWRNAFSTAVSVSLAYARKEGGGFYVCLEDDEKLSGLSDETRRAAFLRCGCGLSAADIAGVMGIKRRRVRELLLRAAFAAGGGKRLREICREYLKTNDEAPDAGTFINALDKRIQTSGEDEKAPGKLAGRLVSFVLLILIGFLLWTGAVLLNYYATQQQTEESNAEVQWNGD